MNVYGKDFVVQYDKVKSGGLFSSDTLMFQASSPEGMPLFVVTAKGSTANMQTFSNSDPVSAMIAAFAIALKLTPKSFYPVCEQCKRTSPLDACSYQLCAPSAG
jgi:hypothetical protein